MNPIIEVSEDWMTTTFKPPAEQVTGQVTGQVTLQVTPQVTPQVEVAGHQVGAKLALSQHQVEILDRCVEPQPLTALMKISRRTDRTKFRNQVVAPLLEQGLLEMTVPDKPRSSRQRYRLTEKGKEERQGGNQ